MNALADGQFRGMAIDRHDFSRSIAEYNMRRRAKQVAVGVASVGGGVVVCALLASKLGVDRQKAALVGGGLGLVGALIASRWL